MITITIHEEFETSEDVAYGLEHIAKLVREGYTSGIAPNWEIDGETEEELLCTIEGCNKLQVADGEFCEKHIN